MRREQMAEWLEAFIVACEDSISMRDTVILDVIRAELEKPTVQEPLDPASTLARMPAPALNHPPGGNDTDVISEAVRKAHNE